MLKNICFWPQFKAEKHLFQSNEAVISITDHDIPDVRLTNATHVLRLKFLDVETITCDMRKDLCYQDKHGLEIRSFIDHLPESVTRLVVHCAMGVSRSAAVALAIEAYTGAFLENRDSAFDANRLVLASLTKIFELTNAIELPPVNVSSIIIYEP